VSDDDAVNEELAAQDRERDDAPITLGFVAYVLTIAAVAVLAVRFGVWVLAVGGSLAVLLYAWAFGTRRRDGSR
jgi:hypothetical protein